MCPPPWPPPPWPPPPPPCTAPPPPPCIPPPLLTWVDEALANRVPPPRPMPPRPVLVATVVLRPLPLVTTTDDLPLVLLVEVWREPPVRVELVVCEVSSERFVCSEWVACSKCSERPSWSERVVFVV
ncbi:MAG: hypothetical protein E6G81_11215 [Alphaproteobacteria bacterium]|nr:MAG: hypothetical protein E6G81_11215 [Alphaproteobacteria bacterium]